MGNHQSSSDRNNHQSSTSSSHLHRTKSPPDAPLNPHTVVDGGFLEPQSHIYASALQEYHRPTVHKLIIERKLAPFYLGLNDFEPEWGPDEILAALEDGEQQATRNVKDALKAAIEAASEAEAVQQTTTPSTRKGKESAAAAALAVMHRERLVELSKIRDKEGGGGLQWTKKAEQAKLYQGRAIDCPICFLYYPPPLVHTRCCDQPICSECFVQIKRADPTATHLESEPAACPFCMEINFGCLYVPEKSQRPTIPTLPSTGSATSGASGSSMEQVAATAPETLVPKPRRKSFAHTEKQVVTTDQLHPDWEAKLEAIKATVARRANRRIVFRQVGDRLIPVGISSGRESDGANPSMTTTALPPGFAAQVAAALDSNSNSGSGRRATRRRNQEMSQLLEQMGVGVGQDLEEMMVMEAMRLSMVEDEERQKKAAEEKAKNGTATAGSPSLGETSTSGARETLDTPRTPRTTANMLSEAIDAPMGSMSLLDPSPGIRTVDLPSLTPSHPAPRASTPNRSPALSSSSGSGSALGALAGGAVFAAAGSPSSSSSFPKKGESTQGNSLGRGLVGVGLVGATPSRATGSSSAAPQLPDLKLADSSDLAASLSGTAVPASTATPAANGGDDSDEDEVPLTPSQGYQQLEDDDDEVGEPATSKVPGSEARHEVSIPARNSSRSLVDAA